MLDFYISPLTETCPELYHYTNAQGLQGIVESLQLHATDINYLNDAEEHKSFCLRRLKELLDQLLSECLEDEHQLLEKRYSGKFKECMTAAFLKALPDNSPFVTSFSIPRKVDQEDGLLSQWRAYGRDGGYALVFSTKKLLEKFRMEEKRFDYPYGVFAPVHYGEELVHPDVSPEIEQIENKFLASLKPLVLRDQYDNDSFPDLQKSFAALSVLFKHRGFHEEQEFRMALLRPNPAISASKKTVQTNPLRFRSGSLTPFIALFEEKMGLPIQRIIVGPHPDKEKRKAAVKALLRQNNIQAEVAVSTIPYLGT